MTITSHGFTRGKARRRLTAVDDGELLEDVVGVAVVVVDQERPHRRRRRRPPRPAPPAPARRNPPAVGRMEPRRGGAGGGRVGRRRAAIVLHTGVARARPCGGSGRGGEKRRRVFFGAVVGLVGGNGYKRVRIWVCAFLATAPPIVLAAVPSLPSPSPSPERTTALPLTYGL